MRCAAPSLCPPDDAEPRARPQRGRTASSRRLRFALGGALVVALVGCPEPPGSGAVASASAARPAPVEAPAASPGDEGERPSEEISPEPAATGDSGEEGDNDCPPKDAALQPMELLSFKFTGEIKNKEPAGRLHSVRPGQRVYAHLTMRNRSGEARCLQVVFRVNGKKRTAVTLKVGESWSWRTWAYNTVHASDETGRLELQVLDDQGLTVVSETLPILKP